MKIPEVKIFDTTLRDGSQSEKISFSVEDKLQIAERLDKFGIHYIEGGWPGSNPKDILFFRRVKDLKLRQAKIVAFGSTRRKGIAAEEDLNLKALIEAGTPAVSIFGKSWLLHVDKALRITPEENEVMIEESVAFAKSNGKEVIYDAEHFFDGYKDDPEYALRTLLAAEKGGADVIVLCDTNGGTLPGDIGSIVRAVRSEISAELGVHAHNDGELAVANSLTAVENGVTHVQGTINGYGERCGNANLCSIIPALSMKMGYSILPDEELQNLTTVSRFVSEIANLAHPNNLPYVGKSAFAHKGGIHVSAVMKNPATYEHTGPEKVGNRRRVLVSDLSGKSNIQYKSEELNIKLDDPQDFARVVAKLKEQENLGYAYEAAEGSLEIMINKTTGHLKDYFQLGGIRILIEKELSGNHRSEATIRLKVGSEVEHIAAEGNGPVHALDKAMRKALSAFYPEVFRVSLVDYKVRVIDRKSGTGARVRVLIDFRYNGSVYGTVGVSENIIEASWQALTDGYTYFLSKQNPSTFSLEGYSKSKMSQILRTLG